MKQYALLGAAACLLSMGLFGCSNTAEGAKQDTTENVQKTEQAAKDTADATKAAADKAGQQVADATNKAVDATKNAANQAGQQVAKTANDAVDATKNAAKDAGQVVDSAGTTGKVKLAIDADKDLNNTNNLINIDTKDDVVHIKGHVQNNADKKKATEIATKTLKDMSATAKVSNELTVEAH